MSDQKKAYPNGNNNLGINKGKFIPRYAENNLLEMLYL